MNILIVRLSSLGDVVHTFPMIADLRQAYPAATIDWVVEEAYGDLVKTCAGVDHVIPLGLRRWRKNWRTENLREEWRRFYSALRARRYDLIFDPQGLVKSALVMRLARLNPGGRRVGLANATEGSGYEPVSRWLHTHSVTVPLRAHAVQRARLLAADISQTNVDDTPSFVLTTEASPSPSWMPVGPYMVFFHGTARVAKQLSESSWIAIGLALNTYGYPVLLPWGNDNEHAMAQRIAAAVPGAVVLPKLSMPEAIALARHASLAVGVDTGLTHVAAAFNRPTIELYCDSPRWKTEGFWSDAIVNLGDEGAAPQAEQVIAAARKLLQQQEERRETGHNTR